MPQHPIRRVPSRGMGGMLISWSLYNVYCTTAKNAASCPAAFCFGIDFVLVRETDAYFAAF